MKHLASLLLLFSWLTCFAQTTKKFSQSLKDYVALNDSISISKYEVTVGEYTEYLNSIRLDSSLAFYTSQLPDSVSLGYIIAANTYYCCEHFTGYFNHPAYNRFPVTGISYKQAANYCSWKTRTYKKELSVKANLIFRLPAPEEWESASHCCSVSRSGSYKDYRYLYFSKKLLDSLGINAKAGRIYKTTFNVKDIGLLIYKDSIYRYKKMTPNSYMPGAQPDLVYNSIENKIGLFHMEDNISEMTSVEGLAKGLNFSLDFQKNYSDLDIRYTKSEPWLGFRLVLEQE